MRNTNRSNIDRVGIINKNRNGTIMTIVEYINSTDITVEFENGHRHKTIWSSFKNGKVFNPYDKTIRGVGFIGNGKYAMYNNINEDSNIYNRWVGMIRRCYSNNYHKKFPTYIGCTVCEEWHNFQNFAKWYDENYYQIDGETVELDKDILVKNNKLYSPETCVFAPKSINSLFLKRQLHRGDMPIGVSVNYNIIVAKCCIDKKYITIGRFDTQEEAFYAYKTVKEANIKTIADKYKSSIPEILYDAMYNYKVEITD